MEENNKQQLEQDMQESVNEETKEQGTPLRSSIIMLLAGVYLLYTGYKLCQDVLNGTNGSSWGFFAAGVGFLIVGVVMLVVGCRDLIKREKAKQAAEAAKPEQKPEEPAGGSTNDSGQVYVPGFGYVDQPGTPQGESAGSDGDWNKQIGDMN